MDAEAGTQGAFTLISAKYPSQRYVTRGYKRVEEEGEDGEERGEEVEKGRREEQKREERTEQGEGDRRRKRNQKVIGEMRRLEEGRREEESGYMLFLFLISSFAYFTPQALVRGTREG